MKLFFLIQILIISLSHSVNAATFKFSCSSVEQSGIKKFKNLGKCWDRGQEVLTALGCSQIAGAAAYNSCQVDGSNWNCEFPTSCGRAVEKDAFGHCKKGSATTTLDIGNIGQKNVQDWVSELQDEVCVGKPNLQQIHDRAVRKNIRKEAPQQKPGIH